MDDYESMLRERYRDYEEANAPATYEEWVEIHGEPDYLYETQAHNDSNITVIDCTEPPPMVDTSEIFYENKKGERRINYSEFTKVFMELNRCIYCNGQFYTPDGAKSVGSIRQDIAYSLSDSGWKDKIDISTNSIINTLQDFAFKENFEIDSDLIPFSNGDLHIGQREFHLGEKAYTPYRLNVKYSPVKKPTPLFDKWLHDTFEDEDITTIQEIMGYALVPSTAAQEAFFLVGEGGVGKSVFGVILKSLLGNGYISINTKDMVEKRFQISCAENKLVVYDDDLGEAALSSTGLLKKLISADQPIPAERKYKDPYNFMPFCKVIACANFMLSSLYDDSDGFYRRLHPIKVKRAEKGRKTIEKFGELIVKEEASQIINWALEGLYRLMQNGWKITWSKRSRDYMSVVKSNGVHFPEFIEDTLEKADGDVSSKELQKLYERWCKENNIQDVKIRRMQTWFTDNAEKYGMTFSYNIIRQNRHVRGYTGVKIKEVWDNAIKF